MGPSRRRWLSQSTHSLPRADLRFLGPPQLAHLALERARHRPRTDGGAWLAPLPLLARRPRPDAAIPLGPAQGARAAPAPPGGSPPCPPPQPRRRGPRRATALVVPHHPNRALAPLGRVPRPRPLGSHGPQPPKVGASGKDGAVQMARGSVRRGDALLAGLARAAGLAGGACTSPAAARAATACATAAAARTSTTGRAPASRSAARLGGRGGLDGGLAAADAAGGGRVAARDRDAGRRRGRGSASGGAGTGAGVLRERSGAPPARRRGPRTTVSSQPSSNGAGTSVSSRSTVSTRSSRR